MNGTRGTAVILFAALLVLAVLGGTSMAESRTTLKVTAVVPSLQRFEGGTILESFDYNGQTVILKGAVKLTVYSNVPWVVASNFAPLSQGIIPIAVSATIVPLRGLSMARQVPVVDGRVIVSEIGVHEVYLDVQIPASGLPPGVYSLGYTGDIGTL